MSPPVLRENYRYLPKDYVETQPGLIFSVVSPGLEAGRIVGWLRYCRTPGGLTRMATQAAERLVREQHPHWLMHSERHDAWLHCVSPRDVSRHYRPEHWPEQQQARGSPPMLALQRFWELVPDDLRPHLGVTGSLLLGATREGSDVDLVVYRRGPFFALREFVRQQFAGGTALQPLTDADWRVTYGRRGCELSFSEYRWHESRKLNKFMLSDIKFDISCLDIPSPLALVAGHKQGLLGLRARVTDATGAFDHPAVYRIDHPDIAVVLAATPTYAGQVEQGEWLEAVGTFEHCGEFNRLIVGSSREAPGEFIRIYQPDKRPSE